MKLQSALDPERVDKTKRVGKKERKGRCRGPSAVKVGGKSGWVAKVGGKSVWVAKVLGPR